MLQNFINFHNFELSSFVCKMYSQTRLNFAFILIIIKFQLIICEILVNSLIKKHAINNKFIDCKTDCMQWNVLLDKYSETLDRKQNLSKTFHVLHNECYNICKIINCKIGFVYKYCTESQGKQYENYWKYWINVIETNDCSEFLFKNVFWQYFVQIWSIVFKYFWLEKKNCVLSFEYSKKIHIFKYIFYSYIIKLKWRLSF
jgi:hypothetical protein